MKELEKHIYAYIFDKTHDIILILHIQCTSADDM